MPGQIPCIFITKQQSFAVKSIRDPVSAMDTDRIPPAGEKQMHNKNLPRGKSLQQVSKESYGFSSVIGYYPYREANPGTGNSGRRRNLHRDNNRCRLPGGQQCCPHSVRSRGRSWRGPGSRSHSRSHSRSRNRDNSHGDGRTRGTHRQTVCRHRGKQRTEERQSVFFS